MAGNEPSCRGDAQQRPRRPALASPSAMPSWLADALGRGANGTEAERRGGDARERRSNAAARHRGRMAGHKL